MTVVVLIVLQNWSCSFSNIYIFTVWLWRISRHENCSSFYARLNNVNFFNYQIAIQILSTLVLFIIDFLASESSMPEYSGDDL